MGIYEVRFVPVDGACRIWSERLRTPKEPRRLSYVDNKLAMITGAWTCQARPKRSRS
jgi:hypothetical protein